MTLLEECTKHSWKVIRNQKDIPVMYQCQHCGKTMVIWRNIDSRYEK